MSLIRGMLELFGLGWFEAIVLFVIISLGFILIALSRRRAEGDSQLKEWNSQTVRHLGFLMVFSVAFSLMFHYSGVNKSKRTADELLRRIEGSMASGHLRLLTKDFGRTKIADNVKRMVEQHNIYEVDRYVELKFNGLSPSGDCLVANQLIVQTVLNPSDLSEEYPVRIRYSSFQGKCEKVRPTYVIIRDSTERVICKHDFPIDNGELIDHDTLWLDTVIQMPPKSSFTIERNVELGLNRWGNLSIATVRPVEGGMRMKVKRPPYLQVHEEFFHQDATDDSICSVDSVRTEDGGYEYTLSIKNALLPGNAIEVLWDIDTSLMKHSKSK